MKGANFIGHWVILNYRLPLGWGAEPNEGFKIFHMFAKGQQGLSTGRMEGVPPPLAKTLLIRLLSSKVPPTKGSLPPLNNNFQVITQ